MQYEVTNIRPAPLGGNGLSEAVAAEIARAYQRVADAGGRIIASHSLDVAQHPRTTQNYS